MRTQLQRRRFAAMGCAALLLSACGGGGGGAGGGSESALEAPPTSAAALQGTSTGAGSATAAALASADRLVQLSASLNGGFVPLGGSAFSPSAFARGAFNRVRERPLATETLACSAFFGTTACTGSITVTTNASNPSATVLPAGTYVQVAFSALSGTVSGMPVAFNGVMRLDYLTAFDLNAVSLAGVSFRLTLTDFSGTAEGVAFGPVTETALFEFDSQGAASITIDGLQVRGLDNLVITNASNYSLAGVSLRRAHWEALASYVDVNFTNWGVAGGRPIVNSLASIEVPGSRIGILVRSSSTSTVVYEVTCQIDGTLSTYIVTATYTAGGGAPTYTAVPG
jgi:hypothetical protein